jgi:cytochrome o ubiquinol oxidase subunit 3
MSVAAIQADPVTGNSVAGHGGGGPAPVCIVVSFGFWVFLLSDIVMFSALFAAYAILHGRVAGGPTGRDLFNLTHVAIETGCLLVSSFTCGILTLSAEARSKIGTYLAAAATIVLGASFLGIEVTEFAGMVARGASPSRSAFLSAFFTLVGTHGLHVTAGMVWLLVMLAQVATRGFQPPTMRRLHCFSLFWHALDIVWVALFSVVYLMGMG